MSNYSTYRCCAVIKCKNTSVKTLDKLWIRVPEKNINMRKTWFKIARREAELLSKKIRLYFCEDHFDLENDMENYTKYKIMGSVKRIRLKPHCVPSKFDCNRKHKYASHEAHLAEAKRLRISTSTDSVQDHVEKHIVKVSSSCFEGGNPRHSFKNLEDVQSRDWASEQGFITKNKRKAPIIDVVEAPRTDAKHKTGPPETSKTLKGDSLRVKSPIEVEHGSPTLTNTNKQIALIQAVLSSGVEKPSISRYAACPSILKPTAKNFACDITNSSIRDISDIVKQERAETPDVTRVSVKQERPETPDFTGVSVELER